MELRHLRYFVAVAEELHFRRAAERLHVAQPAVSEQVRKLEEELGVRLLNRTQRSVSLTDAGAAMLEEARRVLHQAERAVAAARSARDVSANNLRLGYLADSLPPTVPRALQQLQKRLPNTRVSLETGTPHYLIEEVRAGNLDAALVSLPAPTAGLERTLLGPQFGVVAMPVMHRHATEEVADLSRMVPERIVLLPREVNPAFHDGIVAVCHDLSLSPAFVHTLEPRAELALLAVSAGGGIAILPDSVAGSASLPGVRFVPLATDEPICQTAVLTRPGNDDLATKAFTHALADAARRTSAVVVPPEPVATAVQPLVAA
ncbi:MAG: LysR family transcriptional regulator [Thermoleophilaceae bacterium]